MLELSFRLSWSDLDYGVMEQPSNHSSPFSQVSPREDLVRLMSLHLSNSSHFLLSYQLNKPTWDVGRTWEKLLNHAPGRYSDLQAFWVFSQHPKWVYYTCKPIENAVCCFHNIVSSSNNYCYNYYFLLVLQCNNLQVFYQAECAKYPSCFINTCCSTIFSFSTIFSELVQNTLNWCRIHWTGTIVIVLVYFYQLSKKGIFPFLGCS